MAGRRLLPPRAPEPTTTCCCSTRRRSSAAARWRPRRRSAPGRRLRLRLFCSSHSRWFWGCRLHLACAPGRHPRAAANSLPADRPEREVALTLLPRALRGGETHRLRQGLRRPRVRGRGSSELGAHHPPPAARRRSPARAAPRPDPPTHRIGLLDLQGPAQPGASRRSHPAQPGRAHRHSAARPRCLHQPQPPTRSSQPARSPTTPPDAWHQPSSRRAPPRRARAPARPGTRPVAELCAPPSRS